MGGQISGEKLLRISTGLRTVVGSGPGALRLAAVGGGRLALVATATQVGFEQWTGSGVVTVTTTAGALVATVPAVAGDPPRAVALRSTHLLVEQLPQKRRDVSLHLDHLARLLKLGLRAFEPPPQRGVLDLQRIDRLASPWPLERLQRPRLALLAEIPGDLVEHERVGARGGTSMPSARGRWSDTLPTAAPIRRIEREPVADLPIISAGDTIRHRTWGEGIVISVPSVEEILVRFPEAGERRFHVAYAPIEVV